jgi:hypothetical protein
MHLVERGKEDIGTRYCTRRDEKTESSSQIIVLTITLTLLLRNTF